MYEREVGEDDVVTAPHTPPRHCVLYWPPDHGEGQGAEYVLGRVDNGDERGATLTPAAVQGEPCLGAPLGAISVSAQAGCLPRRVRWHALCPLFRVVAEDSAAHPARTSQIRRRRSWRGRIAGKYHLCSVATSSTGHVCHVPSRRGCGWFPFLAIRM